MTMKNTLMAALVLISFTVQAQNVTVDFNTVMADDFSGFGTQYNQNVYSTFSEVDGIKPENIHQLEKKVKNLGSRYVRIFFDSKSWPSDPNYSTVPSDFMEAFIKTVKLAQDAGASMINITIGADQVPRKCPLLPI